ncbi:hypothetical protein JOC86_004287 [Bacillus pakistanensis]|uniref:Uncharacterized protein n=1 Tax=Rossellomorea pakistanensis TaxID=992288 RepID=A0ABS2NIM4_9BACI|nr:hypothetical protein [Bacillus pakistanensis]MBM7587713.1 hypothetical protein [Bacillus pakistanensis]
MNKLFLVVLFCFLVLIHPGKKLDQYAIHSNEEHSISSPSYLSDVDMIPVSITSILQKQEMTGAIPPSVHVLSVEISQRSVNLLPIDSFPDSRGFLKVVMSHSNYLSKHSLINVQYIY